MTKGTVEGRILSVLADFIPDWGTQHKALGRIMDIVSPSRDGDLHHRMVSALGDAMQLDAVLNRGRLDKLARLLITQHYTPEQIDRLYKLSPDSEWGRHWQSEKGTKPPTERALRDTLAMFVRSGRDSEVVDLDKA